MNRYAWLLYQQDLSAWLKAELQCEYIRATDALLDLPKPTVRWIKLRCSSGAKFG